MQNRFIQDSQISFSTTYGGKHQSPWLTPGEMSNDHCWIPRTAAGQWLQVDFLRLTKVTKIKSQGRPSGHQHWVVTYYLKFGNDGVHFVLYQRNGKTKVSNNGNFIR